MIQAGVLGFAHGHVLSFGSKWQESPNDYGVRLVAGWDHDGSRLLKSCEQLKIRPCDSIDDLLAQDLSAVVIGSETNMHADLVEKAAAAGKDIILYKPMSLTMKDADRIVTSVSRYGVRFTMAWQMRMDPQNRRMRELVSNGELGKTVLFRRRHCLSTHLWDNFQATWHNQPQYNRDIFADDSSHPINLMQWIYGMPETVSCEMSTMVNPGVPNDVGVALFRYPNGMIAEISCDFACVASEITTEIYFDKGTVLQYFGDGVSTALPRPDMPGLKWCKAGEHAWIDSGIASPAAHGERISGEAGPLADFLKGGPSICSAEEGRDTLRLVLACYLSAREGCRVSVSDTCIYDF